MTIDRYVPPTKRTAEYDFTDAVPGSSIWVADNAERMRIWRAWQNYVRDNGSTLIATSVTVGEDDPKGPGIRIVFKGRPLSLRPDVKQLLTFYDEHAAGYAYQLNWNGIFSQDDVWAALDEEAIPIPNITAARKFRSSLMFGTAKFCRRYCAEANKPNWQDYCAGSKGVDMTPIDVHAVKKPLARRPGPAERTWSSLNDEHRAKLRRQGIGDADAYNEAFRSCHENWSETTCLTALVDGRADFCDWLRYESGRDGTEFLDDEGEE